MTFHQHLDECEQCKENPFSLCPVGDRLLTDMKGVKLDERYCEIAAERLRQAAEESQRAEMEI